MEDLIANPPIFCDQNSDEHHIELTESVIVCDEEFDNDQPQYFSFSKINKINQKVYATEKQVRDGD